jgi:hypothetical protein
MELDLVRKHGQRALDEACGTVGKPARTPPANQPETAQRLLAAGAVTAGEALERVERPADEAAAG